MELTRLWREIGRSWIVQVLVMTVALLEPAMLLAQGGGTIKPPTKVKPPFIIVGPVDPVIDAITNDVAATTKDAHQNGARAVHARHQATSMRALAKHLESSGLDQQLRDWAYAQDPDVFQFQQPDAKNVEAMLASRKAQGLPTDDIFQALNATPEQKRAALLSLRGAGLKGSIEEAADLFDQLATPITHGPRVSPIGQRTTAPPPPQDCWRGVCGPEVPSYLQRMCRQVVAAGLSLGVVGVIASFFGPIGLIVGLVIATVGFFASWAAIAACEGPAPGPVPGAWVPLAPKGPAITTI